MSGRITVEVGLGSRWRIKQAAAFHGLEVQEFKGFLRSGFVLTGPDDAILGMWKWIEELRSHQK